MVKSKNKTLLKIARRFLALGATALLLGTTVVATGIGGAPAEAASNTDIVVGDVVLTGAVDGVVTVGDTLTVAGSWDASEANPQEGDTFTIGLPPELGFDQPVPFNLEGDGQTWATCLTDPDSDVATCTLTDAVTANPELVKGTFEFEAEAVETTTEEAVEFNLNGEVKLVPLPGDGGIGDGVVLPDDWNKTGVLNSNKWSMTWKIELPGSRLAGHDVINIGDTLSANHKLCEPKNLKIETVRGGDVVNVSNIGEITPASGDYTFGIKMTAPVGGFDSNVTYRLTYETCTPDGQIDPVGTKYTNNATVDVWGDSSGVIGVTQDWAFSEKVEKAGSVLGGANRNGVIQWNVTVAGDFPFTDSGFTFSDTLGGEHELCTNDADERVVQGLKVTEKYGPSNTITRVITPEMLTPATTSAEEKSFVVEFTKPADSDFEFRGANYLYVISYQTCASAEGLPEAGTTFTNAASVNGTVSGSETKVPGRTDRKRGNINTSAVELNGVSHLPQTTLGWNITVPGERLADIDSELTMRDTLTDAHQVCAAEGEDDLAKLLGLKVEARDQISSGGLDTQDITSNATAAMDGDDIVVTIEPPTLPLPDGDEIKGFSKEYQYVITYTTCTTSGGMDAPGTTYGNAAQIAGKTYKQTVTQSNRGSGTGTGVTRGSIAIEKNLTDTEGAQFVPAGTKFTVHVEEFAPGGAFVNEYDLQVPLDGTPVNGLNPRGNGWTVELSEPTFPTVPGVTFGAPVFAATDGVTPSADGKTAVANLTPGTNIKVSLTNSAELGSLEVAKIIDGAAADLVEDGQEFAITASIDTSALGDGFPAQPDREFIVTKDNGHTLNNLPIGATVSFSETLPADDDILTWGAAVISPESIEVLPEHATEPATITVTNTVDRTVGTFSLMKLVSGDQAENPAVPDTVTVTATWDQDGTSGSKTLEIPTDGTTIPFGESLLIGTEVTLTETPLEDGSSIAWGAPTWSGTGVTVDGENAIVKVTRNADAAVTLENHAATSTAGLSLLKAIAGEAVSDVPDGTEFPVTATWNDADEASQSKSLMINSETPTSLGEELPAGTVVTITEGERPEISTVVWEAITIRGDNVEDSGDGSATLVVSDQQGTNTLVTVTNEATWAPGTFSLTKSVEGVLLDNIDVPESFTVTATWLDEDLEEQSKDIVVPADGTTVEFGELLPNFTEVTLSEAASAESDSFSWDAPHWEGSQLVANDDGTATLTIAPAGDAAVTLTNTAQATLGSVEVTKELIGSGSAEVAVGTVFPVTAVWTDLLGETQEWTFEVTAANSVVIDGLPFGTEIRFTEGKSSVSGDAKWVSGVWSSSDENVSVDADGVNATVSVIGEDGATAELTLTNEFKKKSDLAMTGGGIAGLTVLALVLVGLGGGALALKLRRGRNVA